MLRAILGLLAAYLIVRLGSILVVGEGHVDWQRVGIEATGHIVLATVILVVFSAIPIRRELLGIRDIVADNENELRRRNRNQRFLRDVHNSFEMAEYEGELFDVAGLALEGSGAGRAEILVADASNAHVERVAVANGRSAPACGVTTPKSCPAVRQGHTLKFGDPNALSACPRLRERGLPPEAVAACVPINVLGSPSAVLHAVLDDSSDSVDLAEGVRSLEGVAIRFGHRLGMIRAMSQSRHQADTDPLTGLLNRRAMENRVRELRSDHVPFALAMADLDQFKTLNDTYGHDTGDRALRLFSRVMTNALRDNDIICRHGGEEFVIVLPTADVVSAAPVLHRLRERLVDALLGAQLPAFTVSIGLVDSTWADDLPDLLQGADRALMVAKAEGRDRLIIDDPSTRVEGQAQSDGRDPVAFDSH